MKKYLTLVKNNFLSTFSFLNKKTSAAYTILYGFSVLCIAFVMVFLAAMVGLASVTLKQLDMLDILYIMLYITAAFMSLLSAIKIMTSGLFSSTKYNLLSSLPIPSSTILLSELTSVYSSTNSLSFLSVLPCLIGIGIFNKFNLVYYLFSIITLLFVPMLSLILAAIISFFLNKLFLSIPVLKKIFNIVYIGIYVLFMVVYMNVVMSRSFVPNEAAMNDIMMNFAKSIGGIKEQIMDKFKIYPFTNLILKINVEHDLFSLILFIAINLALVLLFAFIFGGMYKSINQSSRNYNSKSNYVITDTKQNSVLFSLVKKDFLLLISHNYAVFQALTGGLISVIMIYAMVNQYGSMGEVSNYADNNLFALIIAAISALMISVAPYTGFSISIEGKSFWIVKSSPIKNSDVFKSKILLNILLNTPAIILSTIIINIKLKLGIEMTVIIFIIVFLNLIFESILSLFFNILKPNLTWDNITKAVKSGAASGFSVLAGFLAIILFVAAAVLTYFFISKNIFIVSAVIILLEIILSILAYLLIVKKGDYYYNKIIV